MTLVIAGPVREVPPGPLAGTPRVLQGLAKTMPGLDENPSRDGLLRSGAPLLVTAQLPPDIFAWADGLRRAHFPPARNKVRAHVTLFNSLPPSVEDEVRRLLARHSAAPPPPARITGLMPLGGGTAFAIESPALTAIHAAMAESLHGVLTAQDGGRRKLHVTVQNKVSGSEAKALQAELAEEFQPRAFTFAGLELHRYLGGSWADAGTWRFRGRPG